MASISRPQRTLAREGTVAGIGIHTGEQARVLFKPAPAGSGLVFMRNGRRLGARPAAGASESLRCTSLGDGPDRVQTVEHLLAALSAMSVDNLTVEVEGPEIPVLDGSAEPFVKLFRSLGLQDQKEPVQVYAVTEPIFCYDKEKAVAAFPALTFSVGYVLDYGTGGPGPQVFESEVTAESFERAIAPARTFCTEKEAQAVRAGGFGKGATPENTVVIGADGRPTSGQLRFADEYARHKALDLIGDLALLGFPLAARVVGIRSGHALNQRLVEAIQQQKGNQ